MKYIATVEFDQQKIADVVAATAKLGIPVVVSPSTEPVPKQEQTRKPRKARSKRPKRQRKEQVKKPKPELPDEKPLAEHPTILPGV